MTQFKRLFTKVIDYTISTPLNLLKSHSFFLISLCLFILNSNDLYSTNSSVKLNDESDWSISMFNVFNEINIIKWKNDAKTALCFSFDDNNLSHLEISEMMNDYGFKGTFFVIASYMYTAKLRQILLNGHEIGSHSWSHPDLTTLDSTSIEKELSRSKSVIDSVFNIHCVSFAEPGHQKNQLSTKITFEHYLFIRNYSEYSDVARYRMPISYLTDGDYSVHEMMSLLRKNIKSGEMYELCGHGMDGEGYIPMSHALFKEILDSVKPYAVNNSIWVAPLKEVALYENLVHEIHIQKYYKGDSLKMEVSHFDLNKYREIDSALICINLPKKIATTFKCNQPILRSVSFADRFILTVDLKKDTIYSFYVPGLQSYVDSMESVLDNKLILASNPISNELLFHCPGTISSVYVYDLNGKELYYKKQNENIIYISNLSSGLYYLLVNSTIESKNNVFKTKFVIKK